MRNASVIVSSLSALALSIGIAPAFGAGPVSETAISDGTVVGRAAPDERVIVAQLVTQDPTVLQGPEAAVAALAPTASGERVALSGNQRIAEITSGDTVYGLARRYGVSPETIIIANDLKPPFTLRIGDRIAIPGLDQTGISQPAFAAAQQSAITPIERARVEPAVTGGIGRVATASQGAGQTITQPVIQPAIGTATPQASARQSLPGGISDPADNAPGQAQGQRQISPAGQIAPVGQVSPVIRPVSQTFGGAAQTTRTQKIHEVRAGETLYSIARTHGLTVSQLAVANNVQAPFALSIGQKLILPGHSVTGTRTSPQIQSQNTYIAPASGTVPGTGSDTARESVAYQRPEAARVPLGVSRFGWPIRGEVIMGYGRDENGRQNDGINIAAPIGTPIKSVADGEVVYRGADLDGYGNLLLIKHADQWVSAYAHTDTMLVQKGDKVRRGQTIAKVGDTGSVGQPQLHFELRHDLQPMDPLAALEGRDAKALAP